MNLAVKAILAGIGAGLALLTGATLDDGIQAGEAVAALAAAITMFTGVYYAPKDLHLGKK